MENRFLPLLSLILISHTSINSKAQANAPTQKQSKSYYSAQRNAGTRTKTLGRAQEEKKEKQTESNNKSCSLEEVTILGKESKSSFLTLCKEDGGYIGKRCFKKKCGFLKKLSKIKKIHSQTANPMFSLCYQVGGNPKKVSFKFDGEEISGKHFCLDRNKKNFIELSVLYEKYLAENPLLNL